MYCNMALMLPFPGLKGCSSVKWCYFLNLPDWSTCSTHLIIISTLRLITLIKNSYLSKTFLIFDSVAYSQHLRGAFHEILITVGSFMKCDMAEKDCNIILGPYCPSWAQGSKNITNAFEHNSLTAKKKKNPEHCLQCRVCGRYSCS